MLNIWWDLLMFHSWNDKIQIKENRVLFRLCTCSKDFLLKIDNTYVHVDVASLALRHGFPTFWSRHPPYDFFLNFPPQKISKISTFASIRSLKIKFGNILAPPNGNPCPRSTHKKCKQINSKILSMLLRSQKIEKSN